MFENIFNFFKKESTRSFLKASGKTLAVGSGIACLFNMIGEISKEKGNRNSGVIWGNFAGTLACGGIYLGLDFNERKNLEHKTKTETQARKEIIEAEADAYEKKRQADAELYDAKAKTDVWKAKAMREENVVDDSVESSSSDIIESEPAADLTPQPKSFMDNFMKKKPIKNVIPFALESIINGCSDNLKMSVYFSLLSMFSARCFSKVRAIGPDGMKHAPNIMVIVEALNGTGKGSIRNVYDELFEMKGNTNEKATDGQEKIIQNIGMNNSLTQWVSMLHKNKGVHLFALEEEIKQVTKALKSQNNPGYEILRLAFDNSTMSKGTRNNSNPEPVKVHFNLVAMGNSQDVSDFYKGQVSGGTLSRFVWTVIEEKNGNAHFEMPKGRTVEQLVEFIKECKSKYCYTTDENGCDVPCEEYLIELPDVCKALNDWCDRQKTLSEKEKNPARGRLANRMSIIAFHCAMVIHMLNTEFSIEEENAQTIQFRKKEQLANEDLESVNQNEIYPGVYPEMAKKMYDAYVPGVHGYKAILSEYGKSCGLNDSNQVKRAINKYVELYGDPKGILKSKVQDETTK